MQDLANGQGHRAARSFVNNNNSGANSGIDFDVVEHLHQAFADGACWPMFLESLCDAVGARASALMSLGPADKNTLCVTHRLELPVARRWQSYFRHLMPERAKDAMPAQGSHVIFTGTDLVHGESLQGDFYEEFLKPQQLRWQAGAWIKPDAPGASIYGLLLWRGADEPDFQTPDLNVLARIVRILCNFERIGVENVLSRAAGLGEPEAAAYLLTRDGGMLMCNDAGAELIEKKLVNNSGRCIAFASPDADRWVYEQIVHAQRDLINLDTPSERTERISGHGTVDFTLGRLSAIGSVPSLMDVCYGLTVRQTRAQAPRQIAQIAQRLYRWTTAEFDTVMRLAEGQPLPDIALARKCSVETVRSHLKNAKRKAGVNRQVDLVRLMLSLQQRSR